MSYRISFDLLTPANAYKIWSLIEKLENKWVTHYDPNNEVPLDDKSKAIIENLYELSSKELELFPLIKELKQARIDNELITFLQKKEKIANILRPLWRKAILEAQEKRREKLSWKRWGQEKIRFIKDFLLRYVPSW